MGIPAVITAAIRVSGSGFLKGLIGRGRETKACIEKELMSSTSNEVCELFDGEKVVRLEGTKPLIQELIYAEKKWYDLKEAGTSEKILRSLTMKNRESGGEDKRPGPRRLEEGEEGAVPPNLSLNLIPEEWRWKLPAAAILGIYLQLLVLIIAGLTTFYPHWKDTFSIRLYAFYCVVGGTFLLTFGLITCVLAVDQGTIEETYKTKSGKKVDVLWLQRGLSEDDESYRHCVLRAQRSKIRTSRLPSGDSRRLWEALTLVGTVATTLGYIIQFIGLGGMHWPTQTAQFAVTLVMTGVRALIRQAPPITKLHAPPDNHEIDWLATNFPEKPPKDGGDAQVWQMMTGWSLGHFENPGLLTKVEISTPPRGEKQLGQTLLRTRKRLGLLCRWTGPARKSAISLATAIDGVMNILHPKIRLETQFLWPLNVRVRKEEQKIWLTMNHTNQGWKSDFTEIEAVLSLGLFGASPKTTQDKEPRNADGLDWLRVQEEKTQRKKSILLLGPSTPAVLRDLRWWLGPQNGKLKKVSLHKNEDMRISKIEQRQPPGFASLVFEDEGVSDFEKYRIAGFESSWQNIGKPSSGQQNNHSFANQSWCLAAVSEVDLELLYARHMFSAFMWTIAKVAKDAKVANDAKFAKVAKEEFPGRTSRFDPKNEGSWQSLKLHDPTVLELANCVQRAGLGDMEDAYLSLIPPLSKTMLLGSGEVFDIARKIALKEQSEENWEDAYLAHRLLFQNFIMFGDCDEMAVKATALFVEFFRLLSRTTELQQKQVVEGNQEDNEVLKLKCKVYEDLRGARGADKFVMNSLAEFYTKHGWYGFWDEFRWECPVKDREDVCELENLQDFLEQTPLHRAAMEGNWDGLEKKLDEDINLGAATDFFNRTALHYAACDKWGWRRAEENIEGLLKVPGIMDAVDCYGMTALHAAALVGKAKIVEVLLAHGAGKEKKLQNRTSLHIAAERGHVEVVKELLDVRADTAVKGPGERTPLHLAVLGCHDLVIPMLLEKEGFDALDGSGRTALHLAALSKHVERLLSEQEEADGWFSMPINKIFENEELKKAIDDNGKTALHLAAEHGHRAVVRALLENGAAVDAKDGKECTALHLAAMSGHEEVVRVLLKKNADVKMGDNDEHTALHLAARSKHEAAVRVVRMLIEGGAAVDAKTNWESMTALHLAAISGHEAVVRVLLENGAVVDGEDSEKHTALHWAAIYGYKDVVRVLLENNAVVEAVNLSGDMALHLAIENRQLAAARVLLENGAPVDAEGRFHWPAIKRATDNEDKEAVCMLLEYGATEWQVAVVDSQSEVDDRSIRCRRVSR